MILISQIQFDNLFQGKGLCSADFSEQAGNLVKGYPVRYVQGYPALVQIVRIYSQAVQNRREMFTGHQFQACHAETHLFLRRVSANGLIGQGWQVFRVDIVSCQTYVM